MTGERNAAGGSESPESTSPSLLDQAKAQNPQAREKLVDLYGQLVFGQCLRAGLRREDAGDVFQEVWKDVFKDLGSFEGRGRFRAWLGGITRHRIADFFRQGEPKPEGGTSHQRQMLGIPEPVEPTNTASSADEEAGLRRRALELVRADFEDRTWTAFWRVTIEERPPAEVAEELGMRIDAVYQAKSRVLRRLRQELRDLEDWL